MQWKYLNYAMFIHYGLYSLLGGIYKGKKVTKGYSEQILSFAKIPKNEYEELASRFTCDNFNAAEIVSLAKKAGMKYLIITSKHHDGFCLFKTSTTTYNTYDRGAKRDLVLELSEECKRQKIGFGIYFSWIDWHYKYALPISKHNSDAITKKHFQYSLDQVRELCTNYGKLVEFWFDMGSPTLAQSQEMRELVKSLQPECYINGRIWNNQGDFVTTSDNKFPTKNLGSPWQLPGSIYPDTWGYREWQERGSVNEKANALFQDYARTLSLGGSYLLNIGPKGDGSIVEFEKDVLLGIKSLIDRFTFITKPKSAFNLRENGALFYNAIRFNYLIFPNNGFKFSFPFYLKPTSIKLNSKKISGELQDGLFSIDIPKSDDYQVLSCAAKNMCTIDMPILLLSDKVHRIKMNERPLYTYKGTHYYDMKPIPTEYRAIIRPTKIGFYKITLYRISDKKTHIYFNNKRYAFPANVKKIVLHKKLEITKKMTIRLSTSLSGNKPIEIPSTYSISFKLIS